MDNSAAAFAAIATELQSGLDADQTAAAIVARMADVVPGADHVSLTLRLRRGHTTLASSSDTATAADGLQYSLREGPCVEVAAHEPWIRSGDVRHDSRWPRWGPRAGTLGVRSLLSVQLLSDDQPHGALNLYSDLDGQFGDHDTIDLGLIYATHAANALTAARTATNLHAALGSRHEIGMAQGIVMERYGLTQAQSFELLRRLSSTGQVKLRVLASYIVETREVPPVWGVDGPPDPAS